MVKKNGTKQIEINVAVIKEQVKQIHEAVLGDDGLVKRVRENEKDINRAKGWAAGISIAVSAGMAWIGRHL